MDTDQLFLASDAALRSVIDRITAEYLDIPVPASWSQTLDPTVRAFLVFHA